MESTSENTVVAVYDNYSDAQKATEDLISAGFMRETTKMSPESDRMLEAGDASSESNEHPGETGIGHFFRSLFGMPHTHPEHAEHHDMYAESMRRGGYVVTAHADSPAQAESAVEIMNRYGPVDIEDRAAHWKQQGWKGYDASSPMFTRDEIEADRTSYSARKDSAGTGDQGEQHIPVVEEEMRVGKREVQRGGVRVFQRVSEKPVDEEVRLREEHVKVERRPVDQPASSADLDALKEGAIEMRETSEEAVVDKTARVVEEVVVSKEASERTEHIKDTVRRTDVDVEQLGSEAGRSAMGRTQGTGMGTTADSMGAISAGMDDSDFRTHWQTSYGQQGGRYEDYEPAYRYGSTMAGNDRYRGRQWTEVESDMRSDWEREHPESTWDRIKDAVRFGAEREKGDERIGNERQWGDERL